MRKALYYSFVGCLMGISPMAAQVQSPLVLERGGMLELNAPEGFKSYQWQVSSDLKNFTDLPDGKSQKLSMKVYAPGFYRVKTTGEDQKTSYADTTAVVLQPQNYASGYSVSGAAHGYVEKLDGTPGVGGINIPEDRVDGVAGTTKVLSNWTDGQAMAVYYFNHPKSIVDTDMVLKLKNNTNAAFRITVWDPNHPEAPLAESYATVKGTGENDTVRIVGLELPRKDYYRYQLECLNGWNNILEISRFLHFSPSSTKTYKAAYLSSPSVHLSNWRSSDPKAPKGRSYDWCYQEVMMPKEADIRGTYIMSLGVLDGYMGIQMNGYSNGKPLHDVIFSMWDHGSVDEDPNLPDNLRANVVDYGPGVRPERFANEGTGMKTFKSGYNWDCDKFVQFITNCRPEEATYTVIKNGKEQVIKQKNTLVSTWYNAQDGKGWQYMATLRLANKSLDFDSWYSFLENYNPSTGQALRKGYYRNGYGRSKRDKNWYHFNQVGFGHTDGGDKVGARNDYGQGVATDLDSAFFMTTGGYIATKQTAQKMALNKTNTPVDTINLAALEARVVQAIEHEQQQMEEKENFKKNKLDKTGWKVIAFSSEEKAGEGSNGRAAQIIDGDDNTYWHSQWQGNKAQYPHYFVVDMQQEYDINGMQITMSGGTNRFIKSFNVYTSNDNVKWEKVYNNDNAPEQVSFQFMFDLARKARYFKLEITAGRAGDGPFVRVNEIEVTRVPEQTGIGNATADGRQFEVASGDGELLVEVPTAMNNAEISVYRTDGACIYSQSCPTLAAGETVRLPFSTAMRGVYVVSCKAGNQKYSKQILWQK